MKKYATMYRDVGEDTPALIMIHGRGSSGDEFISFAPHLGVDDFSVLAPNAPDRRWYPYSFIAPVEENRPALDHSLALIDEAVQEIVGAGVPERGIAFLGFSQGACLALEYAARNARRYGGVIAFTGGLIGRDLEESRYGGNFDGTPVYIGTSDPDPHVPVTRVRESEKLLKSLGAEVEVQVFPNMGHGIVEEEIEKAKGVLENVRKWMKNVR